MIGTLWSVSSAATLAFAQCFSQVQAAQPDAPLFVQVAQARQALRQMSGKQLAALPWEWETLNEYCISDFADYKGRARPFSHPMHWAGFVVMG